MPAQRSVTSLAGKVAPGASTTGLADHWKGPEARSPWAAAARVYADAVRSGAIRDARTCALDAAIRVVPLRVETDQLSLLAERLKELYRQLSAGDVILIDAAGATARNRNGISRERLAYALFESGFDRPLMWAGRKVLHNEPPHRLLSRLLGSGALGAGPRRFAGVTMPLEARADRLIAMACRSELGPPDKRRLRLSVVMPVYNERSTFREVLDGLLAKTIPGFEIEICIVESNSTDGTRDEVLSYATHPKIRLILEDKPAGKGHAVRKGLEAATGDFVLIQDADLEYDLDDYEKLLVPLIDGTAGFVLGSRHPQGERFWQVREFTEQPMAARVLNFGHLLFAGMLNVAFGQKMRDPFTMFKVFRRDAIHNVRFECDRFDFDLELVGKLIRQGYQPLEINVRYNARSFEEGKKISLFGDPPTWIRACLRHRFSTLHDWPRLT